MIIESTPIGSVPFISIDVETTGLDPSQDRIIEVAAVRTIGGEIVGEYSTLVSVDRHIPRSAQRVNGISDDMLVGKPKISEALDHLLDFAKGGVFVEHSHRAFDVAFLETAYGSALRLPYINTCTLSRRLFPHLPRHSLAECCKRFRIENDRPHRALGDARATARLLLHLLELSAQRYTCLDHLLEAASVERG